MTSIDKDSFNVNSMGNQVQSARKTGPSYSISIVGREAREKMYLSQAHIRTVKLGATHPKGAIYDIPSTLSNRAVGISPQTKGSKAGYAHELYPAPKDGGQIVSGDELHYEVDSQNCKYARQATILIGTQPRGQLLDAALLENHSAAFFGRESPGPASVGPKYGPQIGPTKPRMAMACPFAGKQGAPKRKVDWLEASGTPANLGPGVYPRKDVAIGPQYLSKRKNQSSHAIPLAERWHVPRQEIDIISKYDCATSSFGKQSLTKNRSAPSVGFGTGTRDGRSRSALCMHKLDEGPKATFCKAQMSMPRLPSEKLVMGCGMG